MCSGTLVGVAASGRLVGLLISLLIRRINLLAALEPDDLRRTELLLFGERHVVSNRRIDVFPVGGIVRNFLDCHEFFDSLGTRKWPFPIKPGW